jgi:hypothetical protein
VKLLFYSHYFAPSIGGVETIVLSLSRGLAELRSSHGLAEFELTLVTETLMTVSFRFAFFASLAFVTCYERSTPLTSFTLLDRP